MLVAPKYLSPSSISLFRACPQKFKLSYIDKIKEPPSWHMVLGSFVHEVLEHLYKEDPKDRNQETVKRIATDRWSNHGWAEKVNELTEKLDTVAGFKRSAFQAMINLWQLEDPTTTILEGQEVEVLTEIENVAIKGYIDRIALDANGDVVISDYKTGKVPDSKYVSDDEKWFQLIAYALMLKEAQKKNTSTLELYYLSKKVKHSVPVTQEHLVNAQQVIVSTRARIDESCKNGEFFCNVTNLCNWCHYKKIDVCPAHVVKKDKQKL
jgi:RecB family exonuclease